MLGGYKNYMVHYICLGNCKGVAMESGTCQAIECSKYSAPLIECNCIDGSHSSKV